MGSRRLLIANRGEVAARIAHTALDQGWDAIAVRTADDDGPHAIHACGVAQLPGSGVDGYLDADAIVAAARTHRCDAVHPGWGFLAESAAFAEACREAGRVFVGPDPEHLRLLGDKLAARTHAERCDVPVLEASGALENADALVRFRDSLAGADVMIKAAAGGGGRGIARLGAGEDPAAALERCAAEAQAAFGVGTVYAERLLEPARHVEVQVLGDATGRVVHLGERDCSLQRRHQKLVETAPAPKLSPGLRRRLLEAAVRMAAEIGYRSLGTFEFLVDTRSEQCFFIEANTRLQVEHTVTEAVLGIDLVAAQLAVATGASLDDLGLSHGAPEPRGFALQLRINAERTAPDGAVRPSTGRLRRFEPPHGPGIRVDTAMRAGDDQSAIYDPLLAKLVVHSQRPVPESAVARAARAAAAFVVEGVETNLPLLRALLERPEVRAGTWTTSLIAEHIEGLSARALELEAESRPRPEPAPPLGAAPADLAPEGTITVAAPMPARVVSVEVATGDRVLRGQPLAVLEAMKMHHVIEAERSGRIAGVVTQPGAVLAEGAALVYLEPEDGGEERFTAGAVLDLDAPRTDLDEVWARHALGADAARPESVAKRRRVGGRTARENVEDLCNRESFIEYGALAIAAQRRRRSLEDLMARTPADGMVAGIGTVNADEFGPERSRCAVLAYDYTVLAGTQGHINHKKKDRLFELALEWELPVVFFTEGGGGRPGDVDTDDVIMSWLDIKTFTTWPRLSGVAPRIAVNFGRCFAGNAVVFGCADITVATRNSNIGLAGPAMIEGGGLGRFAPEDIGPIDVQTANGVVDLACEDEVEATAAARRLLGYFQGPRGDWSAGDQRALRHLVPEDRLRVYDMRRIVEVLADEGSVTELRRDYGVGLVTAFVRIEGRPFGLIANDPRHLGGAIDGEGGEKGGRFLQLCDAYGVPVVSLLDTPGFMVGPESERSAAVRRGSRLILASANLAVPLFTVVVRKAYGLGAQAMAGGGLHEPFFTIAWPTAELGPMGLEGAVELGFRKELDAAIDVDARRSLFEKLVGEMYEKGKAVSVAQTFELDAVIDPAETRRWLLRGLVSAGAVRRSPRPFVDVW